MAAFLLLCREDPYGEAGSARGQLLLPGYRDVEGTFEEARAGDVAAQGLGYAFDDLFNESHQADRKADAMATLILFYPDAAEFRLVEDVGQITHGVLAEMEAAG